MEPREALPLLGFRRKKCKEACPASAAVAKLCRTRASKRWSALLTQTKSRIGFKCGMRERLGETNWAAFVKYAEAEHKAAFFRALTPASGVLRCEGTLDGAPCPTAVALDLARAFRKRRFIEPLAAGHDILGGLHANTHLPTIVAAAAAVDAEAADAGEGDAARAAEGLRASVQAYCTLQLGYAYAGTAGSSVNEHWPRRAAWEALRGSAFRVRAPLVIAARDHGYVDGALSTGGFTSKLPSLGAKAKKLPRLPNGASTSACALQKTSYRQFSGDANSSASTRSEPYLSTSNTSP